MADHDPVAPGAVVSEAGLELDAAFAVRAAVPHLALILAEDRVAVVSRRAFRQPQEPSHSADCAGRRGVARRLPQEIEAKLGMRVPGAERLPHEFAGGGVPDELAPLLPGTAGRVCIDRGAREQDQRQRCRPQRPE